jgi:hypothetical protein
MGAQVNQVIGIDLLGESLMPAIENLAEDNHWRVRLAIIKYIPMLASQMGADAFQQQLGKQCMSWLEDQARLLGAPQLCQHYFLPTSPAAHFFPALRRPRRLPSWAAAFCVSEVPCVCFAGLLHTRSSNTEPAEAGG